MVGPSEIVEAMHRLCRVVGHGADPALLLGIAKLTRVNRPVQGLACVAKPNRLICVGIAISEQRHFIAQHLGKPWVAVKIDLANQGARRWIDDELLVAVVRFQLRVEAYPNLGVGLANGWDDNLERGFRHVRCFFKPRNINALEALNLLDVSADASEAELGAVDATDRCFLNGVEVIHPKLKYLIREQLMNAVTDRGHELTGAEDAQRAQCALDQQRPSDAP